GIAGHDGKLQTVVVAVVVIEAVMEIGDAGLDAVDGRAFEQGDAEMAGDVAGPLRGGPVVKKVNQVVRLVEIELVVAVFRRAAADVADVDVAVHGKIEAVEVLWPLVGDLELEKEEILGE